MNTSLLARRYARARYMLWPRVCVSVSRQKLVLTHVAIGGLFTPQTHFLSCCSETG